MKKILLLLAALSSWAYSYSSENIYEIVASNSIKNQSAANYDKYLFIISNKMERIMLYDLQWKRSVYVLVQPPYQQLNGRNVVYHCNQSCFGKQKYQETDYFPLLYISQRNETDSTGAFLSVMRIVPEFRDNEIASFSVQMVQKIYFPPMTDENCMGLPSAVIDQEHDIIYTYSRNLRKGAPNYTGAVITKLLVPKLWNNGKIQSVVHIKDNDRLDYFTCGFNLSGAQGGCYVNGKIYLTQGCPRKQPVNNFVYFRVIDTEKRKCIRMVDMLTEGFDTEPEGCWSYDGRIMLTNNGRNIYRLIGDNYKL